MFVSKCFLENISRWNLIIQEVFFFSKNLSIINRLIHIMFIRTAGFFTIRAATTLIPTSPEVGSGVGGYFDGPLKARGENGDFSLLTSFQGVGRSSEIQRVCRTLRRSALSQHDGGKHMRIFQMLCDNTSSDMYRNTLFVLVCCYITSYLSRGFLCDTDGAFDVTQLKIFQMLFACWFACTVTEDYPIRQRVQEDHHTADTERHSVTLRFKPRASLRPLLHSRGWSTTAESQDGRGSVSLSISPLVFSDLITWFDAVCFFFFVAARQKLIHP